MLMAALMLLSMFPSPRQALAETAPPVDDGAVLTIRFDPCGACGEMAPIEVAACAARPCETRLPENQFTRDGYEFAGWQAMEGGSGGFLVPDGQLLVDLSYEEQGPEGVVRRDLAPCAVDGAIVLSATWTPLADGALDGVTENDGRRPEGPSAESSGSSESGDGESIASDDRSDFGLGALVSDDGTVEAIGLRAGEDVLALAPDSEAYLQTALLAAEAFYIAPRIQVKGYFAQGYDTSVGDGGWVGWKKVDENTQMGCEDSAVKEDNDLSALGVLVVLGSESGGMSFYIYSDSRTWQGADSGVTLNPDDRIWRFMAELRGSIATHYDLNYGVHYRGESSWQTGSNGSQTSSGSSTMGIDAIKLWLTAKTDVQTLLQVRYQNEDGTYGSWSTVRATTAAYRSVVDAWSRAQDETYDAASIEAYLNDGVTRQVSIARRTATNTIQARYQEADGTYGPYSDVSSGIDRVGEVRSWSREADATYKAASAQITGTTSSQTKQVSVERQSYTASFSGNGGSDGPPMTRLAGAALGSLPTSSRAGYSFDGWFTAASGGSRITSASAMPASNATYHAHWTRIVHAVAFDANGGEGYIPEKPVSDGDSFTVTLSPLTRPGYRFAGYNTARDGSGTTYAIGATVTPTANMTLFCQWEPLRMSFSVPAEIGYSLDSDGTLHGPSDGAVAITNEGELGIAVTGIRSSLANGVRLVSSDPANGECLLRMAPGSGSGMTLAECEGPEFVAPTHPAEWAIPPGDDLALTSLDGKMGGASSLQGGTARIGAIGWRLAPTTAQVAYAANGGSGQAISQRTSTGIPFALPECPYSNDGKSFAGWSTSPNGNDAVHAAGSAMSFDGDVTLYAQWSS